MSEVTGVLETFWFDLFNRKAMEEMRTLFHPDYEQVDRRALTLSGGTRDEWQEWTLSWWDAVPDLAARKLEVLAESDEYVAYLVVFAGHDAVSGGEASGAFYVINRFGGGLFLWTELFDDRAAVLARFAELTGS